MARKKSKTSTMDELLNKAERSQWCIVDTNNRFSFDSNIDYVIDQSVKQYAVLNKPQKKESGQWNDWTNESLMTQILVVDTGDEIRFFDENLTEVNSESISFV